MFVVHPIDHMDNLYLYLKLGRIRRQNGKERFVDPQVLFKGFYDDNMLLDFPVT